MSDAANLNDKWIALMQLVSGPRSTKSALQHMPFSPICTQIHTLCEAIGSGCSAYPKCPDDISMLTHLHFNGTAIRIRSILGFSVLPKFHMQTVGSRDLEKAAIYNDAAIVKPQCYSMFQVFRRKIRRTYI